MNPEYIRASVEGLVVKPSNSRLAVVNAVADAGIFTHELAMAICGYT